MKKMKSKIKLSWILSLLLSISMFTACKKDKNITANSTITSSIFGRVADENGNGIYNATAIAGGKTTTTDVNGIFKINNVTLDRNNATVKITKAGFFDGSRTFIASEGNTNNVEIILLNKISKGTFSSSTGSTINISADASVTFPANAIKKADGTTYTGTVYVYATNLDPTDADITTKIPGDLLGLKTDNTQNALQSFGMLNVELEDASGNKLNIADGKEAIISTTVPSSLLADAPATIALWHFDTNTGLWKEEGSATLTGNKYIGNVSHFSWWGYAISSNVVKLSFHLVDVNGTSFQNKIFHITNLTNGIRACGITDNNGNAVGFVPKNVNLRLETFDACRTSVFAQNIGPFANDYNAGDIVLNAGLALTKFTGKITSCSNGTVSNGYIKYTFKSTVNFSMADANGNFSFILSNCASASIISITAYDMDGFQQGITQSFPFTTGATNIGNVSACNSTIQEYFQFQVDGGSIAICQNVLWQNSISTTTINCDNAPLSPYKSIVIIGDKINGTGVIPTTSLELTDGVTPHYSVGSEVNNFKHIVTQYPAIGGYIEGTISGSFVQDIAGTTHTINGSYRIKRTI